ncbi:MAG: PorT family protein [Bacteroidales bacterium]|nr:PorT family protein [Bacteroidales bacterium]
MKQFLFSGFICAITFSVMAQEADSVGEPLKEKGYQVLENDEVEIITDEIVKKGKADSTTFRLGTTEINIIEEDGETSIKIKEVNKNNESESDEGNRIAETPDEPEVPEIPEVPGYDDEGERKNKKGDGKFKGHWAGFSFGLNNYIDKNFSLARTPENEFLNVNTGKSWNFNLNISQYSFPVYRDRFGLVTGLGFEWSNYHFENNNSIQKLNGSIQPLDLPEKPRKNRLQTTYLTIPLLAELQFLKGGRNNRLFVSGGLIGGLKLTSNVKIKVDNDPSKTKDDFYLNPFRYGLTARVGYKMVKLYANYYITPLFVKNRGPELYPVAAGLLMSF